MNDQGKTVNGISKVAAGYRRLVRGKQKGRYIDISMRLHLVGDNTVPAGYEGTMAIVGTVRDRVVNALAQEFLP